MLTMASFYRQKPFAYTLGRIAFFRKPVVHNTAFVGPDSGKFIEDDANPTLHVNVAAECLCAIQN